MTKPIDSPDVDRVVDLLHRVEALLADGRPRDALAVLGERATGNPFLENARGVAFLRDGQLRAAVDLLRGIALRSGSLFLDTERPTPFHLNFATALLLERNARGCLAVLEEIGPANPGAIALRDAIAGWRRGLGWWSRVQFDAYGTMKSDVLLAGPPGEIVYPDTGTVRRAA